MFNMQNIIQHPASHTTAVQSPSHCQWYSRKWKQQ